MDIEFNQLKRVKISISVTLFGAGRMIKGRFHSSRRGRMQLFPMTLTKVTPPFPDFLLQMIPTKTFPSPLGDFNHILQHQDEAQQVFLSALWG